MARPTVPPWPAILAAALLAQAAYGAELPQLDGSETYLAEAAKGGEEPAADLTLREALALALRFNPALAAFSQEIRAAEAAVLQAGARPNPVLELAGENLANDRLRQGGDRTAALQIGQLIELGGKRGARVRLAETARGLAAWDYEAKRIDVLSRVSRQFIEVIAAQQAERLAAESAELAARVADAVEKRVRAGRVSPIEETKARLAASAARVELEQGRRQLDGARRALTALWANSTPRFLRAAGDLETFARLPAIERLTERVRNNPELARWSTEIAQRQATLDVQRAKRVPDITLSAGVKRFSQFNDQAYVVGVSIPIPVFDQNRGGILEAGRRRDKALLEQSAAESRLLSELAQSYYRIAAVRSEIDALRSSILPGARSAYDGVTRGYELGRFGILDVLDAQRTLFQAQSQYLRALAEYGRGVGELERLVGGPLDEAATGAVR